MMELASLISRLPRQWYYLVQRAHLGLNQGATSRSLNGIAPAPGEQEDQALTERAIKQTARDDGDELEEAFRRVYRELRSELESSRRGEYVVINVKTGEHVVARWPDAAMNLAERAFGSLEYCWSKRIGTP